MTKQSLWLLPLAAALILTGCSSTSDPEASTSAGKESGSEQQQLAPAHRELNADQVKSVVEKLVAGDDTAQIIDNAAMQPQLELAKDMDPTGGIAPEKCAKLQEKYSVTDLTGTVAASATTQGDSVGKVIQVFSVTDKQTLKNITQTLKLTDLTGCETVTVSVSDQKITTNRQILKLDSTADLALTTATQMQVGENQYLNSVAVQGLVGNNFVLVTFSSGSVEAPLLAGDAMRVLDQAYAEIGALK